MRELAILLTVGNTSPSLSWNLFDDLASLFHYEFMVHAFEAGTIVAIIAGAIGYFVVLRASAFAAHALSVSDFSFFIVGMISAAIFGYLAIKYFLKFISKNTLQPFIIYRVVLGVAVIGLTIFGILK